MVQLRPTVDPAGAVPYIGAGSLPTTPPSEYPLHCTLKRPALKAVTEIAYFIALLNQGEILDWACQTIETHVNEGFTEASRSSYHFLESYG